jgi:hypothetical protein
MSLEDSDFIFCRHSEITRSRIERDREWIDISAYGDDWEVEMDAHGDTGSELSYRYRRVSFNGISTDWIAGRPPTGFHKTRVWCATFYPQPDAVWRSQDGDIVIYGRKGSTVGCSDPSCSIWMIPGTGHA